VFADALVPKPAHRARVSPYRFGIIVTPAAATSAPRTARAFAIDGYRFAKPHGKPNPANSATIQQNMHFGDCAIGASRIAFRFDSSRCLNCSSNLIGHDDRNKPANGDGR
jgi:hypothetical protein